MAIMCGDNFSNWYIKKRLIIEYNKKNEINRYNWHCPMRIM